MLFPLVITPIMVTTKHIITNANVTGALNEIFIFFISFPPQKGVHKRTPLQSIFYTSDQALPVLVLPQSLQVLPAL